MKMFFKHNKDQGNNAVIYCDVYQGKHEVTTKYFVKLDDGQFVAKNWYDNAVSRGTGKHWMYTMGELKDAKRMQREYGGTIYEEIEDTYVRPYVDDKVPSQHQCVVMGKDDTWVTIDDKIEQLRNDGTSKPRVEADMTTDVRLDNELVKSINALTEALSAVALSTMSQHEDNADKEHQPKIHELSKYEQPKDVYANNHVNYYYVSISSPETMALLSKSNTRLAIIEDDEDA